MQINDNIELHHTIAAGGDRLTFAASAMIDHKYRIIRKDVISARAAYLECDYHAFHLFYTER